MQPSIVGPIGFSTGTLAYGDFRRGLELVHGRGFDAVELSALRDRELPALISALDGLDLSSFTYVSVHAPSRYETLSENEVLELLEPVAQRQWPIIVHPDVIHDFERWHKLGSCVCVENMDKRKEIGQTAKGLAHILDRLPEATLCFDIGHARQVDPTMCEAALILNMFSDRLTQVHVSEVNSRSKHERLSLEAIWAFGRVAEKIPTHIPLILETPVSAEDFDAEVLRARRALHRTSVETAV